MAQTTTETKFLHGGPLVELLAAWRANVRLLKDNGAEDSLAVRIREQEITQLETAIKAAEDLDQWGTTREVALLLKVGPRRVTMLCNAKRLEWRRDSERSPYRISMRSAYKLRACGGE